MKLKKKRSPSNSTALSRSTKRPAASEKGTTSRSAASGKRQVVHGDDPASGKQRFKLTKMCEELGTEFRWYGFAMTKREASDAIQALMAEDADVDEVIAEFQSRPAEKSSGESKPRRHTAASGSAVTLAKSVLQFLDGLEFGDDEAEQAAEGLREMARALVG